jgi:ABC-type dipeptide/oligopeptide/nickel transport system permease component
LTAEAGLSPRSVRDDLWLVAVLAFGSVLFFSSVLVIVANLLTDLTYRWIDPRLRTR